MTISLLAVGISLFLLWALSLLLRDVLDTSIKGILVDDIAVWIFIFAIWFVVIHFLKKFISWLVDFIRHESNYMLYPCFSWSEINEVVKRGEKYGKKANKLYEKVYPMEGKLPPISEDFKKNLKQYIEFRTVSEICGNNALFMIRANRAVIEEKKNPSQVREEYWWNLEKVYEDETGFFFDHSRRHDNTEERIEKEYQSELKRLEKVRSSRK